MTNKSRNNAYIDIFLVVMIAFSMIALIHISDSKIIEVLNSRDSIILRKNPNDHIDVDLANEMLKIQQKACTMLETYDKNFNLISRVSFEDDNKYNENNIINNKSLKTIFKSVEEGHSRFVINDCEEDIYFRWVLTSSGESKLIILYVSRPVIKNLWLIPFICYIILMLIFILITRIYFSNSSDKILRYNDSSNRIRTNLNR